MASSSAWELRGSIMAKGVVVCYWGPGHKTSGHLGLAVEADAGKTSITWVPESETCIHTYKRRHLPLSDRTLCLEPTDPVWRQCSLA
jgi:hypothetical protein